jgi:3',5'-cyclic AMP phosphodiesterase CpdA
MSFFFIQMADPQFGMFAAFSELSEAEVRERRQRGLNVKLAPRRIAGFADETALYEKAIDGANRLRPDFVVMCGDMVNDHDDLAQLAELRRITAGLRPEIPMYWVAGNHDVGNDLTPTTLAQYRARFGDSYYAFSHRGSHFIVLDSNICFDPSGVPGEWERQLSFLEATLGQATKAGSRQIVAFMHHPLFVDDPDEEGDPPAIVIPRERRRVILELLKAHGTSAVFAGHWHRNNYARDGELEMVASGSVGYPLGDDPSGFRVVHVLDDRLEHRYFGLDDLPQSVEPKARHTATVPLSARRKG